MRCRLSAALLALLPLPMPALAAASFVGLELPGSQLSALSRDGQAGAGNLVGAASGGFRWRAGEPAELLHDAVSARAISPSGQYVAGSALDAAQREVAACWDAQGKLHAMSGIAGATAAGGVLGIAFGITDEPRVVGLTFTADSRSAAFSWTPQERPQLLPAAAGDGARATGIGADGSRIYGWIEPPGAPRRAALWSAGELRIIDAEGTGEVLGANRAGDIVFGISRHAHRTPLAWRWSADAGLAMLTAPASHPAAAAQMTAGDDAGALLAGSLGSGTERVAAVWTADGGVQTLERFLHDRRIAIPSGWTLAAATAVCGDGHCIGGWGQHAGHFDSFIVGLPAAGTPASDPASLPHRPTETHLGETTR
jgi:uncharacterized membrane protein